MRELKFRVWSKLKSQWVENMMLLACIDGLPFVHIVEVVDDESVIHHVYNAVTLDCVIQQHTGLKDKNGKDIYEGDIVRLAYKTQIIKGTVRWDSLNAAFLVDGRHGIYGPEQSVEVIGNIYENNLIKTELQ